MCYVFPINPSRKRRRIKMAKVTVQEVSKDLFLLRVEDTHTRYFEALWEIPEGITYNAYVLKTPEGAILFDGWKRTFEEEFIEALTSVVSPEEIKHIVIHHMEPDHTGTLPRVLSMVGEDVNIWGHPFVKQLLASLYGLTPPNLNLVKSGNSLTFGGRELVFYHAPWLHWPETIVTHLPAENILLTGDIFGGYSIPAGIFDDELTEDEVQTYMDYSRKYTVTVIGFYRDKMLKNLNALESKYNLRPSMILPAHGLLWRGDPQRIVRTFQQWGEGTAKKGKITVVYSSMYRYVEKSIQVAIDELKKQGYEPIVYPIVDDQRAALADILGDVLNSEAIILGTETYEADVFPYTEFLLSEIRKKANAPHPLLVLGVFGWAAAAGRKIKQLLEGSAFDPIQILEVKGLLTPESESQIRESVRAMLAGLQSE